MDVKEAIARSPNVERQLKREHHSEAAELLATLRRAAEQYRRAEGQGYKVGAAARMIGVHRNTVRAWIERGLLRAKPVQSGSRRDYLIPAAEVKRAAQAHEVSVAGDPLTAEQVDEYEAIRRTARGEQARGSSEGQHARRVVHA